MNEEVRIYVNYLALLYTNVYVEHLRCRNLTCLYLLFIKGWMAVICQRDAVKLWPQFSAPTPLV